MRYENCTECGQPMRLSDAKYGLCPVCAMKFRVQNEREYQTILLKEVNEIESERTKSQVAKYEREYATLRQQNSRLARKYGLAQRRERYGEFVELSDDLSTRRSDDEKTAPQ